MIWSSRPLRFLVGVFGVWTAGRGLVLWSDVVAQAVVPRAEAGPAGARPVSPPRDLVVSVVARAPAVAVAPAVARDLSIWAPARPKTPATSLRPLLLRADAPAITASPAAPIRFTPLPETSLPGIAPPPTFRASRWSGSGWAILRPAGRATPFASQLGGSQAGARIAYAIDGARRVAIYARASTAVDSAQREAAVGLDWRPTRLPVHLIAEQRIGIEGIRGGTALGAIGGFGPTRVAGPVRGEAYAQAGVILRDGREGFVDGSLRVTMPVVPRVDLGLGAWGGVQKGASRVDVGPTLGVTLPVERRALRLSVDWRHRVVGDARPGSGPAVSAGVDF